MVRQILALERPLAGEHLVQHYAECPDIGALVDRFPARLLRRHVRGRAEDHSGLGRSHADSRRLLGTNGTGGDWSGGGLRESEVKHLDVAVLTDFDVGGLEIAMHDPFFVRGFKRIFDFAERWLTRRSAAARPS